MDKILPLVAIVGQPNVGKSTLMNKISGKQVAVTSDIAGTTRDRQYLDTSWNNMTFTLVDTAGLSLQNNDQLEHSLNKQIDIALKEADMVVFVVDGRLNRNSVEQQTLSKFRKIKKPVMLVVNKLDSPEKGEVKLAEFLSFGIKPTFGVSSVSGRGIGDMLDYISETLAGLGFQNQEIPEAIGTAVSIIGKPNVGKSSIFNKILKEERVVVSPIAGTTRTAIDSYIKIDGQDFTFIDTAGLKKKEHRQEEPDIFSGFQTFKSIRRSDVCFFVIDASEELTKQDQRVAQEIFAQQKGCIILGNKIDIALELKVGKARPIMRKKDTGDDKYRTLQDYISTHFPFLWMSPLFFVSGLTGEGIEQAVDAIQPIYERRHKEIDQDKLDAFLAMKLKANEPKLLRDQKKPKVYSLHQIGTNPPAFQLVVNEPASISQQFRKYIENSIIKDLDFWGTPIKLHLIAKDKLS
jgi:GTP-binding protein